METKIIKIEDFEGVREAGLTYGLCHGAFDLVHPGHVRHFESAKRLCDRLIVSLTSDVFVQKRKGSGRPVYKEDERAYIISCLEFVDYVVISPYERAVETLEAIKPDLYIKGPDYKDKQTAGILREKETIEKLGGKLVFTDDAKYSTTDLLFKIKQVHRDKMLLILDRDGTLIEDKGFLGKEHDWKENIVLKRSVVDYIHELKRKYELTMIVVSNQAGVAWGYFKPSRVKEINQIIDNLLQAEGLYVAAWVYCPVVDSEYAKGQGIEKFVPEYVAEDTDRKPSVNMVFKALKKLDKSISEYERVLVLGDRGEDEKLAENLKAEYKTV